MEERVPNLERDYDAFVADISAQYTQHSRLLQQLVRDNHETRMRLAAMETRQNNMDEKLGEMREDITAMQGDIVNITFDIHNIKGGIHQILVLLGQRQTELWRIIGLYR